MSTATTSSGSSSSGHESVMPGGAGQTWKRCTTWEATFRRFNFCIATRKCDHSDTTHTKFAGRTKEGKVRANTPAVSMKLLLHTSSTHSVGSRWSPSAAKASGTVAIAGTGTFSTRTFTRTMNLNSDCLTQSGQKNEFTTKKKVLHTSVSQSVQRTYVLSSVLPACRALTNGKLALAGDGIQSVASILQNLLAYSSQYIPDIFKPNRIQWKRVLHATTLGRTPTSDII